MSAFTHLEKDDEFKKRWGYVWLKLEPILLARQRDYARDNKGKHEDIGRFTEFMSILMEDLEGIDATMNLPDKPVRKRLNNEPFKQ